MRREDYKLKEIITEKNKGAKPRVYAIVKCVICGTEKKVLYTSIKNGSGGSSFKHASCIYQVDKTPKKQYIRFKEIYDGFQKRINNPNTSNFNDYGGRGLTTDYNNLIDFYLDHWTSYLTHVHKYGEKNTQLDRVDNNLGYIKGNLKWSTRMEQCRNRRNTTVIETHKNKIYFSLTAFCEEYGFNRDEIKYKLKKGERVFPGVIVKAHYKLGSTTKVPICTG
jgi:hypothetical protein